MDKKELAGMMLWGADCSRPTHAHPNLVRNYILISSTGVCCGVKVRGGTSGSSGEGYGSCRGCRAPPSGQVFRTLTPLLVKVEACTLRIAMLSCSGV
ncbi:hypothetical protein AVEN_106439-1 [Araneus ventricosus]|uniref:Uncharacterized protein n=1 Tax=Araneus ventricosus TaxID=182803 RepID=A0A4Y2ATV0_ARAVE|nr:hypothetical protein AVEN_106439-1 [Araneus ventricosus]